MQIGDKVLVLEIYKNKITKNEFCYVGKIVFCKVKYQGWSYYTVETPIETKEFREDMLMRINK
ncbi:MAG: hypothetical protein ACRCX8_19390 [Sarcina sp.]